MLKMKNQTQVQAKRQELNNAYSIIQSAYKNGQITKAKYFVYTKKHNEISKAYAGVGGQRLEHVSRLNTSLSVLDRAILETQKTPPPKTTSTFEKCIHKMNAFVTDMKQKVKIN